MTEEDWGGGKIVTLRLRRGRKKESGEGEGGEKKISLPDIIVLLGNYLQWQTELLIGAA